METKKLWQSKTFWSDVLTLGVGALTIWDHYFGTHILDSRLAGTLLAVASMVGVYGRKTADTKIEGLI